MQLLFLDVETTGLGETARVVQLAYKNSGTQEIVNELFRPPVIIEYGAMAVHHITNEMICNKPSFEGSECQKNLVQLLQDGIVVAHNAPFDVGILRTEGVHANRFIDTLRVAQHLMESESYGLQYLRYSLNLNTPGTAHDALGDVMVLESLFYHLLGLMRQSSEHTDVSNTRDDEAIISEMIRLSTTPVLQKIFPFGKYAGKTFAEVAQMDRSYLQWLFDNETKKHEKQQNENLVFTLKAHLKPVPSLF